MGHSILPSGFKFFFDFLGFDHDFVANHFKPFRKSVKLLNKFGIFVNGNHFAKILANLCLFFYRSGGN